MRTKSIQFPNTRGELSGLFDKLQRAIMNQSLVAGSFGIVAASKEDAENTAAITYMIDGQLYSLDADTAFALEGTVTADAFNVYVLTVDESGTPASIMGTEGASLDLVTLPDVPEGEVVVGLVIVNPTGTGNFVGGTTELDDATVVPNAVFVDIVGALLPELREL